MSRGWGTPVTLVVGALFVAGSTLILLGFADARGSGSQDRLDRREAELVGQFAAAPVSAQLNQAFEGTAERVQAARVAGDGGVCEELTVGWPDGPDGMVVYDEDGSALCATGLLPPHNRMDAGAVTSTAGRGGTLIVDDPTRGWSSAWDIGDAFAQAVADAEPSDRFNVAVVGGGGRVVASGSSTHVQGVASGLVPGSGEQHPSLDGRWVLEPIDGTAVDLWVAVNYNPPSTVLSKGAVSAATLAALVVTLVALVISRRVHAPLRELAHNVEAASRGGRFEEVHGAPEINTISEHVAEILVDRDASVRAARSVEREALLDELGGGVMQRLSSATLTLEAGDSDSAARELREAMRELSTLLSGAER